MKYQLIVGLGNPGVRYCANRHNIGFLILDALRETFAFPKFTQKFHADFAVNEIEKQRVIFLKPLTYMNKSGVSVAECVNFYKINTDDIIVIHDDLDLALARIKIKQGGGSGGHNGLRSIDSMVGNNYFRMRFGIDKPTHKGMVSDYVLSNFTNDEMDILGSSIQFILDNFIDILRKKYEKFLNDYASYLRKQGVNQNGI